MTATNSETAVADEASGANIIPLGNRQRATARPDVSKHRFKVSEFENLGGSKAWRVSGTRRDGSRVRENFGNLQDAQTRRTQLELEFYSRTQEDAALRATKLTDHQLRICESALHRLDSDDDLLIAVDYWLRHGRQHAIVESPRLDEAVEKFKAWLAGAADENGNGRCTLREFSRRDLRTRVNVFCNSVPNVRVADVSPKIIANFLGKLSVSAVTRNSYRRNLSGFFAWCKKGPRRWIQFNPVLEVEAEKEEGHAPKVLTVAQARALLKVSEAKGLAPYVALCLFGGLRPHEAQRVSWHQINLVDAEIRLEADQTKTGRGRVVTICPTLAGWLRAHKDEPILPPRWLKTFKGIKARLGLKPWVPDILRHTAVSHFFRRSGSYGLTAEWAGNSEAVIKDRYQGLVNSEDTKGFYALLPKKGGRK